MFSSTRARRGVRTRGDRTRSEAGAVAILVAAMATAMFVLAALVVDLGMARDTQGQSQASADAAALAAANTLYLDMSKSVTQRIADAVTTAKSYAASNNGIAAADWTSCTDPGHLTHTPSTQCISFNSSSTPTTVRVRIPTKNVKVAFAPAAGVSSINVAAASEAQVTPGTSSAEGGLRPWGICSNVVTTSGNVVFVPMKGGTVASNNTGGGCGNDAPPGGWWVAQCTGQSNSNGATEASVLNGCSTSGYAPVPSQTTAGATALYNQLTAHCPRNTTHTNNCLDSDPGNNFHNSSDAWQTLVGHTITMPVFCFPTLCSSVAYTAQGQNATYAIQRIATVEICGFEFQPRAASTGWPTTGPCATSNPNGFRSSDVTSGGGIFLVIKGLTGGPTADWTLTTGATDLHLSK